jgi:hypothetical protein
MIRTPDQRVRVFVSSTLEELAAERQAVSAAITQLRLTPVLFELGARPYPPRDLYRSGAAHLTWEPSLPYRRLPSSSAARATPGPSG